MAGVGNGGIGMTARVGLIAAICHLIAAAVACPAVIANPSPGPSPLRGGGKNTPGLAPPSLPGKGVGGLGLADSRFEFESKHMGTLFRVVLYAKDEASAKKAADAAFARVAQLDNVMSDYKQDSELMKLCRAFATATG